MQNFKYRKKPVVIDAFQYYFLPTEGLPPTEMPFWFLAALLAGTIFRQDDKVFIKTLEGNLTVSNGDFIIRGVQGELHACKPDIFAATYEPANE